MLLKYNKSIIANRKYLTRFNFILIYEFSYRILLYIISYIPLDLL